MRKGFLKSAALFLAGSGVAFAQSPSQYRPISPTEPSRLQVPAGRATVMNAAPQAGKAAEKLPPAKEGVAAPSGKPTGTTKPVPATAPATKVLEGGSGFGTDCGIDCNPCMPSCCNVCGPEGRYWVSVEYLLWWIKTGQTPPLLTTSPDSSLGILGQPGTRTLIGGRGLDRDPLHGARFTVGGWLDCNNTKGFELSYFFLSNRSFEASGGGPGTRGSATTARPFFNVLTGREDSQLVSFPTVLAGTATITATSRLQGLTPNLICNLFCCSPTDPCNPHGYRVDLLVGPRFYHLEEDLNVRENLTVANDVAVLGGSRIRILDSFDTENRFYGGFVGARGEFWRDRLFANATGGLAIGSNHQVVTINGNTVITPPTGAVVNRNGGLLTQQTNIGRYSRDEFAVIPEFSFNIGYQVNQNLRAYVGYSLIYWTDVLRPGDQIDRGINTTQLPTLGGQGTLTGPRRPAFSFNDSDFWAQGINFGLQFRY